MEMGLSTKRFWPVWVTALVVSVLAGPSLNAGTAGWQIGPTTGRYASALLVEAERGEVLFESNARSRRPPASMTKMMVMLLVAERVREGQLHWETPIRTSRWASRMGGSQVYLKEGEVFTLGEMMQAITIHSANDAAVAVAEAVAGTVSAFVDLMNARARGLGLVDTVYHSVHGLPPGRGQSPDLTSARDLSILARELVHHQEILDWARTPNAPFRDGKFRLTNTNRLIRTTKWVDGLKTGYYRKVGFNVTATGVQNGLRLIAVVMGAPTKADCFETASKLLSSGFASYTTVLAVRRGDVIADDVPVRFGNPAFARVVAGEELKAVVPKRDKPGFTFELTLASGLEAPLLRSARVGEVVVKKEGREIGRVPALAADAVARQDSLWDRLF